MLLCVSELSAFPCSFQREQRNCSANDGQFEPHPAKTFLERAFALQATWRLRINE